MTREYTRYYHRFKDGKEGEELRFDEWSVFLHPDNKCQIVNRNSRINQALKSLQSYAQRNQIASLERLTDYIKGKLTRPIPIFTTPVALNLRTFDVTAKMDDGGNYVELDGRKGTPYEKLGLTHIVLPK